MIQKILPFLNSAPQKTLGAERYAQTDHYPDHKPPLIMSSEIDTVPFTGVALALPQVGEGGGDLPPLDTHLRHPMIAGKWI